jgi:ABC-2 type transport system permease protein
VTSVAGTGALIRLALRRDRVRLTVWVVAMVGIVAVLVSAIGELYPDPASRQQLGASVAANPAFGALLGPLLDPLSAGGLVAWRASFLPMVLVPLMALQTVSRHSRAEEESGRLELLGSTRIGHRAPLTAALAVALGASVAIGVLVTLALAAQGEALAGSVALGAVYAASGAMFAGIAAVTAQLVDTSRGASGLAGAVLGVAFLVRGVADGAGPDGPTWLRWLSPAGWMTEVRPFAGERWWVFALMAGLVVASVAAAYTLVERRDLGSGLLPPRPGPATAAPGLASPLALAWRLHRATLAWWTVGMLTIGAVYGAVAESIGDLLQDVPGATAILELVGGADVLVDAFLTTTLGILGMIVAGFTLAALLRARTEETALRVEPLLAAPVTRARWLASHVTVAVAGTVWLLAVAGFGEGLAHGLRIGEVGQAPRLAVAALAQVPAVLVLAGVALTLLGWAPRAVGAVWGALVASLLLGQLGPLLQLDQWALDLSPFTHVPRVPSEPITATPVIGLLAVAAALGAAGLAGLRRRDIA